MTNDFEGLFDIKTSESSVQIGNGNNMSANAVGKYRGTIIQKDGKKMNVVLEDVCYVPDLVCNLFSVTAAMSKGWKLSNEGRMMNISQGETTIKFDHLIGKKHGHLCGVQIKSRKEHEHVGFVAAQQKAVDIKKAHQLLGHPKI